MSTINDTLQEFLETPVGQEWLASVDSTTQYIAGLSDSESRAISSAIKPVETIKDASIRSINAIGKTE